MVAVAGLFQTSRTHGINVSTASSPVSATHRTVVRCRCDGVAIIASPTYNRPGPVSELLSLVVMTQLISKFISPQTSDSSSLNIYGRKERKKEQTQKPNTEASTIYTNYDIKSMSSLAEPAPNKSYRKPGDF